MFMKVEATSITDLIFQEASYVTFDLEIPRRTSFGLYARLNALPTHTHHNFMQVISGLKQAGAVRQSRATEVSFLSLIPFPFPLNK